jgi:hypothetical protein
MALIRRPKNLLPGSKLIEIAFAYLQAPHNDPFIIINTPFCLLARRKFSIKSVSRVLAQVVSTNGI